MSKHADGPWEKHQAGTVWARDRRIAIVQDNPTRDADAALIAAAPELLKAYKRLMGHASDCPCSDCEIIARAECRP